MNLLLDSWVPVQFANGSVRKISPRQIPGSGALCVAHPRADFNALTTELLVCLFQTFSAPSSPEQLTSLISGSVPDLSRWTEHEAAFDLFGLGHRFMQAPEDAKAKPMEAAGLLYEYPTENTLELNKDHFLARNSAAPLCPHCAPVALFLNQSHARMGGQGYRTGPRENSVMTALVRTDTLWQTIVLNLLPAQWFAGRASSGEDGIANSFPWMRPAQFFNDKKSVALSDLGRFGSLWWTPVALRLALESNPSQAPCFCCAQAHPEMVTRVTKRSTPAYLTGETQHPHTGWFTTKKSGLGRAVEVPSDGFTYEHWLALTVGEKIGDNLPAWQQLGWRDLEGAQLWIFGYKMNSMSPVYWLDVLQPVLAPRDGQDPLKLRTISALLLEVVRKATASLKTALLLNPKKISSKSPALRLLMSADNAALSLGQRLTPLAIQALREAVEDGGELSPQAPDQFGVEVRKEALRMFDRAVDDAPDQPAVTALTLRRRADLHSALTPKTAKASK